MDNFTWVETYREIAKKLREYRNRQNELLKIISEIKLKGIPTISLKDRGIDEKEIPLSEIDPFTFFSNFNRGTTTENRIAIIKYLKEKWNLSANIPDDFSGVPVVSSQLAWFFAYEREREVNAVSLLWELFIQAMDGNIDEKTFNSVLDLKYIHYNITMGLFWINPEKYLNLDKVNRTYLVQKGIVIADLSNYKSYLDYMTKTKSVFQQPFAKISHDAWLSSNEAVRVNQNAASEVTPIRYWVYAPGEGAEQWDDFYSQGIMAIGWDSLGDLERFSSKEEIAQALRDNDDDQESSKKNNAGTCYAFCHEMKPGDMVFAKIGMNRIIGQGIISSDYEFAASRAHYKHLRRVDWKIKGKWVVSDGNTFPRKTVTELSQKDASYLISLINTGSQKNEIYDVAIPNGTSVQFWWLNANPKIWDFNSAQVGSSQRYTSHNAKGNERRVYQHFKDVKPGDFILGYVTSPQMQIVALCKVTKGLHDSPDGEVFEFEKIEQFPEPIPLKRLQSIPELKNCEPLINNQGSLFKLRLEEFELIRSIIDEENADFVAEPTIEPGFDIKAFSDYTGFSSTKIEEWVDTIKRKKHVVFFGPPGTGKTFLAVHLAKHIVSGTGGFYDSLQFHPSYTYEEFMQGIRPDTDDKGQLQFELKTGRFMEFCKKARQRKGPCVLIIDEINRANLSRVFGELMFLLEYRDKEIVLAGGHRFSIPSNVMLIATMNTADRSIALVDFALRRRFAFIELVPEYELLVEFHRKRNFNAQGLVQVLRDANAKINDKNFHIGISFFMDDNFPKRFENIWKVEIETFLEEYFSGQLEAVDEFRWNKIRSKVLL